MTAMLPRLLIPVLGRITRCCRDPGGTLAPGWQNRSQCLYCATRSRERLRVPGCVSRISRKEKLDLHTQGTTPPSTWHTYRVRPYYLRDENRFAVCGKPALSLPPSPFLISRFFLLLIAMLCCDLFPSLFPCSFHCCAGSPSSSASSSGLRSGESDVAVHAPALVFLLGQVE